MTSKKTRNVQTYYLSEQGYRKLKSAIASEYRDGYTLENLAETVSLNNDFLSIDTISTIINRTNKTKKSSIQTLFYAFDLTLEHEEKKDDGNNGDLTRIPPIITDGGEYDPNFVGRENAIADLDNLINKGVKLIQIIAPGGVGKSTLAKKYLEKRLKPS